MTDKLPFIRLYKTYLGYYFFDVNKNEVISVSQKAYSYLKDQLDGKNIAYDKTTVSEINTLKSKGYLSANRPKIIEHEASEFLDEYMNRNIQKITIQVTQSCNLRCSYCIYSDLNNEEQRSHSANTISAEKARKAVDFLFSHSIDKDFVNIGFYGGEPLIAFDVVKDCVLYTEEKYKGKKFCFALTTNGTLLDLEKASFFMEHDVSVMISLDGPREIHNTHRRFAINGKGSYDCIMDNLREIKEKLPEFYAKLRFNMVIDPQNNFDTINDITNEIEFNDFNVTGGLIDDAYSVEKISFSDDYTIKYNYNMFLGLLSQLNLIKNLDVPITTRLDTKNAFAEKSEILPMTSFPEKCAPSGPCIPGQLRLFMAVDGTLYPCERVNETSEVMKIGTIDTGFDLEKIYNLLNVGNLTPDECRNCWAFRMCMLCARHADNGKNLSGKIKLDFCEDTFGVAEARIRNHILEMECKSGLLKI